MRFHLLFPIVMVKQHWLDIPWRAIPKYQHVILSSFFFFFFGFIAFVFLRSVYVFLRFVVHERKA
jgi:hypothetical protein